MNLHGALTLVTGAGGGIGAATARAFAARGAVVLCADIDGAAAEYVALPAALLGAKPRTLDHVSSASIPLAGLTAWQALVETAGVGSGMRGVAESRYVVIGDDPAGRDEHIVFDANATPTREVGTGLDCEHHTRLHRLLLLVDVGTPLRNPGILVNLDPEAQGLAASWQGGPPWLSRAAGAALQRVSCR